MQRTAATRTTCVSCDCPPPVCTKSDRSATCGAVPVKSGERKRRGSSGGGEWNGSREPKDALHGGEKYIRCGDRQGKSVLRDDAGARVLAQRAAQLLVED